MYFISFLFTNVPSFSLYFLVVFQKEELRWLCCCLVTKLRLTLLQPHGLWSPPGSSVHGILQAKILEWVTISSSRGSSQPRYRMRLSCIAGEFFTTEPPGKT